MNIWADHIISRIWYTNGRIYNLFLHPDNGEQELQTGEKRTKDFFIALLKKCKPVVAAKWAYNCPQFKQEKSIVYFERGGVGYLRTFPDESLSENLANKIFLSGLGYERNNLMSKIHSTDK